MYAFQTMRDKKTPKLDFFSNLKLPVWKLTDLLSKTRGPDHDQQNNEVLRFEISSKKMNSLLLNRQICAADIRCLDENTKHCLKQLCLKTCLHNAH